MPYIKAHPFGYKKPNQTRTKQEACRNIQCTRVQTVTMTIPVDVPIYNKEGIRIGSVRTVHTQTKTIYHSDISHKSGYTLAESYWNSVLNSNGYGAFQNKYRKKAKSLAD